MLLSAPWAFLSLQIACIGCSNVHSLRHSCNMHSKLFYLSTSRSSALLLAYMHSILALLPWPVLWIEVWNGPLDIVCVIYSLNFMPGCDCTLPERSNYCLDIFYMCYSLPYLRWGMKQSKDATFPQFVAWFWLFVGKTFELSCYIPNPNSASPLHFSFWECSYSADVYSALLVPSLLSSYV